MNKTAIALALRTAAEALDRARQLASDLPAGVVDETSMWALVFHAPGVAQALFDVAGTLDPEGGAELVGELYNTSPPRRAV